MRSGVLAESPAPSAVDIVGSALRFLPLSAVVRLGCIWATSLKSERLPRRTKLGASSSPTAPSVLACNASPEVAKRRTLLARHPVPGAHAPSPPDHPMGVNHLAGAVAVCMPAFIGLKQVGPSRRPGPARFVGG